MESQKIINLLNDASDSKFMSRKWNIANNKSKANYDVGNEIIYKAEVLKSHLCYYNDAYILVRGNITIIGYNLANEVAFTNCAPFTKYITKIDGTTIDDAGDLDLVMLMYNLIEYSSNYSDTTGILWFYSKDEAANFMLILRTKMLLNLILGNTEAGGDNGIFKSKTITVPLKYLSNFWRSLQMPLIKCKVELKLK